MKIILSHPTGNAFAREAVNRLYKNNLLFEFHTAVASFPGEFLDHLGGIEVFAEIRRRRFDPLLKKSTKTSPWREFGRQVSSKVGLNILSKHETGIFSVDAVYRDVDRKVASQLIDAAKKGVNAVYAYEDGAVYSFNEARRLGLECFYDLPIGYWRAARRLLKEEVDLKPEWASTIKGFLDSKIKLERKDEELEMADRIYVASTFTAETLADFPGHLAPIEIIPYGFPPVVEDRTYLRPGKNRPLKLLFVGGLSQRKGIAEMFSAVDALQGHVELTLVGRKGNNRCPALEKALAKHRWIPSLPHHEVLNLMQQHDVLLFPSLFEGFGLVITEAMSRGTPVITTERTAGPDLIVDGQNGWLTKAGSASGLQRTIEKLLEQPEWIAEAGKAAMETARKRPWEVYGRELVRSVSDHIQAAR